MKRANSILMLTCALIGGCPGGQPTDPPAADALVIFHNGTGPMCLDALQWLESTQAQHQGLIVEEYLTPVPANLELLNEMRSQHGQSQGVSTTFGYLPIIFYRGQAFSGFNDAVNDALTALVASAFE